ncbi:MAG: hypothetical protein HY321_03140 [Armatimonadetes bacterium]|nr:hypothetical protein [Armatimonadota bacterium]
MDISRDHPLRRLFESLVYRTFAESVRMPDPEVARYVADILTRFVHMDNAYRLRDARGRRLEEVAEMLMEGDVRLNARSFSREREVHKHIGDFTLFWTGVYPEALRLLRAAWRKDHLVDYVDQGRKSYYIASTFDYGDYRDEARTLRKLSEWFEYCTYGLSLVRQEWERLGDPREQQFRRLLGE